MDGGEPSAPFRYNTITERLEAECAMYMSIGMTYDQFWDGEPEQFPIYRKAYRQRLENQSYMAWLQGEYIYEAILDASPVLNPLSKETKPYPYRDRPISLLPSDEVGADGLTAEDRRAKAEQDKIKAVMMGMIAKQNKEGGVDDGE